MGLERGRRGWKFGRWRQGVKLADEVRSGVQSNVRNG